jgi:hypothetical protein
MAAAMFDLDLRLASWGIHPFAADSTFLVAVLRPV